MMFSWRGPNKIDYDWITATKDKPDCTVKLHIPNGPLVLTENDAYKIVCAYNAALLLDRALKLAEALQKFDRSLN